ncbi:Low temperature requirement A [Ceraceosorus bombacis]|uniref:Low temperature requirement A n=1 Tax=Ceraceosorus bombacis TaxID=401625 RepID=A0A0P1BBL5_9BASI|nr:Low temperature requirement A [Ceraceosorus bombacis]
MDGSSKLHEQPSTVSKTAPSPQEGHGHAHHLKWGEVVTSGFAPPSAGEDDDSDLDDPCHSTKDGAERRRKMTRDRSREQVDAEARRLHAQRRYLFRKPRPLQYFRGNVLVRSNEERGSGRLELFFDLVFVGIIAVLAQSAVREPTGASFVRYLLTYTAAYTIWNWMREMFDSFYKDDFSQRVLVVFVMACLTLYGNNAIHAQDMLSEGSGRAVAVAAYLLAELGLFSTWLLYSFYIKAYRVQIRAHALVWICTSAIWIGSIFVDSRAAIAMVTVALVVEWNAWQFCYSPSFKRLFKLRYSSAIAIEHEIDRFSDFYTIVLGEFCYSLFDGNPTGSGFHEAAGRAILCLLIAWAFQLFYMNGGSSKKITHPLRHGMHRALLFFNLHLPIVSALTLCGDAMADLIHESAVKSGVRWIACESYAVGMLGLWCLATLEVERDAPGELWFPKWARLTPRLLSSIVAALLPLTRQKLEEEVEGTAEAVLVAIKRAAAEGAEGVLPDAEGSEPQVGFGHGPDITTTKLLGILTALSLFTLLWETISSLDGPNAPDESASDDLLERAKTVSGYKHALRTPAWRGFPRLAEPGSGTFDHSHQRSHPSSIAPTAVVPTATT